MKRSLSALMLAAAVGGCATSNHAPTAATAPATARAYGEYIPQTVPGVVGPYGEPIPLAAPYTSSPPVNAAQARRMMADSVPLSYVQMDPNLRQVGAQMPGMGGMMAPPGMPMSPPMMAPGGGVMPTPPPPGQWLNQGGNTIALPSNMGMVPGMGGGFPGIATPSGQLPPGNFAFAPGGPLPGGRVPGAVAALGAITGPGYMPGGPGYKIGRTQIRFARPSGMKVAWLTQGADGKASYSGTVIEAPGRYNFLQAAIYKLKLSNIEGRPGMEIYPTLEVVPCNPKTEAFLAHSAVPIEFTPEDFQEVADGKYVVKVIYLPDPQYQELAAAGTEEIISTRLEPGADPLLEAQRRGSILLVIRMGNVDQEAPNTPPLDTPGPNQNPMQGMMPPGMMPPGMAGPMGPMGPGGPSAGPQIPNYLRSGPGLPAAPPAPTGPSMPGNAAPTGPISMLPDAAAVRSTSTLPPRPSTPVDLAPPGPMPK
jgi:hypothetical protein